MDGGGPSSREGVGKLEETGVSRSEALGRNPQCGWLLVNSQWAHMSIRRVWHRTHVLWGGSDCCGFSTKRNQKMDPCLELSSG